MPDDDAMVLANLFIRLLGTGGYEINYSQGLYPQLVIPHGQTFSLTKREHTALQNLRQPGRTEVPPTQRSQSRQE